MANKIYRTSIFIGLAAVLIFSSIARGAVKLWSITPVLLVLYAMIFLLLMRMVNKNGDSPHHHVIDAMGQSPFLIYPGTGLLSQPVARQVPSTLEGLTSVFGMGTGVAPPLIAPGIFASKSVTAHNALGKPRHAFSMEY